MDARIVSNKLADLGIVPVRNDQGELKWSLDIVVDGLESQPRTAYFDRDLGKWKLGERTSANASNTAHQPLTRSQVNKSMTTSLHLFGQSDDDQCWTDTLPRGSYTDLFCQFDWAATPLGRFDTWSHALRLYTHMLFSDSRAAVVWWGPQRIAIYNHNLLPFIGRLHPMLMGQSFESAIPDHWDLFRPIFQAMERGQPGLAPNGLEVALERHGYLEETWWDGSLISLRNDEGAYGGAYFSWIEVTRTVLQDRKAALVNLLGQSSNLDGESIWQHIHQALSSSPRDIPMAMLYRAEEPFSSTHKLHLQYTLGVGKAHTAASALIDLSSTDEHSQLASILCLARDTTRPFIMIDLKQDPQYSSIVDNFEWLGYQQPSRHLVVIPLRIEGAIRGFIILGLNPRRNFDNDHEQFVADLVRQVAILLTGIATEERRQRREEYLVKELTDSERRISRMAETVPVGIYDLGADGAMRWANTSFFDIMGVPQDSRDPSVFDWRDHIVLEDQDKANTAMAKCLMERVNISDSLRLQRPWTPPGGGHHPENAPEPFWVMYSASPDVQADGTVGSLLGCITDISHLKWAEQLQARIADAAEKEKRKQEEFIDITSHEIRNPLSAITQCADSIIASFQEIKQQTDIQSLIDIIKLNVEDAESILFCTVHQRRIINDILTLGKLDSGLLTIAPISFHPRSLVDEALQMFKAEFEANDIDVRTVIDKESVLTSTSSVRGDCARLMQVLVNLLTNAIKFTRTEATRSITIRSGSSYQPPETAKFGSNFHWVPSGKSRPDLSKEADYGTGEAIFLYYSVMDSGKGIPGESANRVFSKFEQADRRTHTKYGGSGLGLFISRELTELQGGRIGVHSQEGIGSTFVFYTKARRERDLSATHLPPKHDSTSEISSQVPELEARKMENDSLYQTDQGPLQSLPLPSGLKFSVLLVEDNILNQKVLAKQLTKAGCVVQVANDGEEAVSFVHQTTFEMDQVKKPMSDSYPHFDCILMDWEMPVCDGLTATKRIREMEAQQGIRRNIIIGITANARPEQLSKAMNAGMDSIVPKPFRVPELLIKIGEHVDLKGKGLQNGR